MENSLLATLKQPLLSVPVGLQLALLASLEPHVEGRTAASKWAGREKTKESSAPVEPSAEPTGLVPSAGKGTETQ